MEAVLFRNIWMTQRFWHFVFNVDSKQNRYIHRTNHTRVQCVIRGDVITAPDDIITSVSSQASSQNLRIFDQLYSDVWFLSM